MARSYRRDWRGRFAGGGGGGGRPSGSSRGRGGRNIKVSRLKNGRKTAMSKKRTALTAFPTRGTTNILTGNRAPRFMRPGTPIRGNNNRRYLSRTHTTLSGVGKLGGIQRVSPAGRLHSRHVIRKSGGKLPKSGYVVEYSN